MADYIRKNILCQAYIHADLEKFNDEELKLVEKELNDFVKKRAQFFLYEDVEINVEFGEGSFKSWAGVLGTLSAIYLAIANYPNFREGVIAIHDDVIRLSNSIVSESLFVSGTRHKNIIRIESRTGVIGALKRILDQIFSIGKNNGVVTANRMQKMLLRVKIDITRLLNVIKNEEDLVLIKKELLVEIKQLPTRPKAGKNEKKPEESMDLFYDIRKLIIGLLK